MQMLNPPAIPKGGITSKKWNTTVDDNGDFIILVIDPDPNTNWAEIFKGSSISGSSRSLKVEQCDWSLITLNVDEEGCHCQLAPSKEPIPGTNPKNFREIIPNFLLIRQYVRGIHQQQWINTLLGFMIANIPSVNSLESIFCSTERATNIAELYKIQARLGKDKFPLVPITYFPNTEDVFHVKNLPVVAKVGSSCAGFGKMKFTDNQFSDFATTLAMFKEYVTLEPFVTNVGDVRIQKIGDHIRVYKRVSSNWKGNVGESVLSDLEVTDQYKLWAVEASKMWGGLDILSIDCVIAMDGKHTILEVNDTATGLNPDYKQEDLKRIRDLVLSKIVLLPQFIK